MATYNIITQTDASNKLFPFTFPYLKETDVKVGIQLSSETSYTTQSTSAYTFANATTIEITSAPAASAKIKIFRDTANETLRSTFYPGSALRAADLNDNYTQVHYVSQETEGTANDADTTATAAKLATDRLVATTADGGSTWTLTGGNTDASTDPKGVKYSVTTAETALSNSRKSDGSGGYTSAISVADAAKDTADTTAAAVADAVIYTPKDDFAALKGFTPTGDGYYELTNSTSLVNGDWTFGDPALTYTFKGKPDDFTGAAGLTVRMTYDHTGGSYDGSSYEKLFTWKSYFANDPEDRYSTKTSPTFTTGITLEDSAPVKFQDSHSNEYTVGIKAPAAVTTSYTLTLPAGVGESGKVLKTSDAAGALTWGDDTDTDTDTTYGISCVDGDSTSEEKIRLTAGGSGSGTNDIVLAASTGLSITRDVDKITFANTVSDTNTTYTVSCVDGDSTSEEKIRLTAGGSGSSTDDVVLAVGAGLSITRDSDKITFANTVSDTNTTYTAGDGLSISSTEFSLDLSKDQTWTGSQRGNINTLTSATSITIDFGAGNNFILTTGHSSIEFANPSTEVAGQSGSIFIVQGSTTCAAPTWENQWYFAGGTAPSFTATENKIGRVDYIVQAAGKIHVVATDNLGAT